MSDTKNIEIINYPHGSILKISEKELNILLSKGVVRWDDEYEQYGYDDVDKNKILSIIGRTKP